VRCGLGNPGLVTLLSRQALEIFSSPKHPDRTRSLIQR